MSSLLLEIPLDILLDISLQLDLADAIALLSTSQSLRKVMSEKYFWIQTLTRLRREQLHPIAVPLCSDLPTLSLLELQEAGKRTNRLMKNWKTAKPTMESIRKMYVDAMSDLIVIPGTGLVIVHGPAHIACWDIFTEGCVARLVLPPDVSIESATFEEHGKVMLGAIATAAPCFHAVVICIDHRVRTAVTMSEVLSHAFAHPRQQFVKRSKVTVERDTVHVVVATKIEPHQYNLLSVSLTGEQEILENVLPMIPEVQIGLTPPRVSIKLSPSGPYFLRHMATSVDIVHLTGSLPRLTHTVTPLVRPVDAVYPRFEVPADPMADIVHLTVSQSQIEFWPASHEAGQLVFGPVASFHLYLSKRTNAVVGTSGLYTLLVCTAPADQLVLLRYIPGASPAARALRMPLTPLDMQEGRLALDDHLGLVLSMREDGQLVILSYA
ncbi:hypothetical protein B0H11DRAFT_278065 [Mycena galericulata]|nr:hypothetical protein B0H11DRAFT_278065 [Mycena galericulata]